MSFVELQPILFQESIRSKTFDWNEFKKLNTYFDIKTYTKSHLQEIGHGGSRLVYLLSSKKVLKIDEEGYQNRNEWKTANKTNITPRVYDVGKSFTWLVVELVNPITREPDTLDGEERQKRNKKAMQKFESISGIPWNDFETFVAMIRRGVELSTRNAGEFLGNQRKLPPTEQSIQIAKSSTFMAEVKKYIDLFGSGDISRLDHWGVSVDGELKFLDPGVAHIKSKLNESIRSKTFDWNEFESAQDKYEYALKTLEKVNDGGSRSTFILNSNKVLKIDREDRFQNTIEWKIGIKGSPITPKVFKKAENYSWIVVELVKPFEFFSDLDKVGRQNYFRINKKIKDNGEKEFEQLSGMPWLEFVSFLREMQAGSEIPIKYQNSGFLRNVAKHISKFGMEDMGRLDHWGKSAEGRIVFLDPGVNNID